MNIARGLLVLAVVAAPSISFLKYQRPLQPADASGQHYVVVDEAVWTHARADLADLRLYSGQREVPFALTVEMGGSQTEQRTLRILQPGTLGGMTQFLLDMGDAAEYDCVLLKITTRNFVAHARVEGQDDPHGKNWTALGVTTLFDLSDEKLGHNSTLHVPLSTYKYLRVTLDRVVKPADVQSATSGTTRAEQAVWLDVSSQVTREKSGRDTVLTFSLSEHVPIEQITFAIDPAQPNFRRVVQILGDKNEQVAAGEISRIHMQRNANRVDLEQTSLNVSLRGPGKYRVIIRNGDDLPLKITAATPQQHERRIYLDVDAGAQARLLYGDEKLEAPIYDYRTLFQKESTAKALTLGSESLNDMFTGRPDERPWSERYPALLWAAIIFAVLLLGAVAVRSIKSASA